MKRFSLFVFVCALGWLGFVSGTICTLWKFLNSTTGQCEDCPKCFAPGVTQEGCKDGNGQCYCKKGHKELTCKSCKTGWHGNKYVCCSNDRYHIDRWQCKRCGCYNNGTVSTGRKCDDDGNCNCTEGYQGTKCEQCGEQYYKVNNECKDCGCNNNGTVSSGRKCDDDGNCNCTEGYQGTKCEQCGEEYYEVNNECKVCGCNKEGVENDNMKCDPDGQCNCKTGYHGKECCEEKYPLLPDKRCPVVLMRTFDARRKSDTKYFKMKCNGKCDVKFYTTIVSKVVHRLDSPPITSSMSSYYPSGHVLCAIFESESQQKCCCRSLFDVRSTKDHACNINFDDITTDYLYFAAFSVRGKADVELVIGTTNIESINQINLDG